MNILERFETINTFVFDIDGVLTDGSLLVQENGVLLRTMNIKDGYALQWAIKQGYHVWIISGAANAAVKLRLQHLGLMEIHVGIEDKVQCLQQLQELHTIAASQMLYMGDDMPDIGAMQLAGFKTCPADAVAEVKALADYVSPIIGGKGCVRDVIEKVMKLHGKWA
jgi:3-deoxy-D-manno-octulosonate 8-phosphate phosphatase (KDO 8-P phosphatase)